MSDTGTLTAKDFQTDQEVRWCPDGDYSILKQVHTVLPQLGIPWKTSWSFRHWLQLQVLLYEHLWYAQHPRQATAIAMD